MAEKEIRTIGSAVIMKDGKILLEKRSRLVSYPERWNFPGGKQDPGEELSETAARECKEECNLEFVPGEKLGSYTWETKTMVSTVHVFLGEWSGTVKRQILEIAETRWCSYEEAMKLPLAFNYEAALDELRKRELL